MAGAARVGTEPLAGRREQVMCSIVRDVVGNMVCAVIDRNAAGTVGTDAFRRLRRNPWCA